MYRYYSLKFVGVYSKNSPEWIILDAACCLYGLTTVPIYDTLGEEATEFMFQQTNLETLFLTCNHIKGILTSHKNGNTGSLKHLIIMDEEEIDNCNVEDLLEGSGLNVYTFKSIMEIGITPY